MNSYPKDLRRVYLDSVARIYRFGEAILTMKEKELLTMALEGSIAERLQEFRNRLICEQEQKYLKKIDKTGKHPSRIRKVKGKIQSIILETDPSEHQKLDECRNDLDRLYAAMQLYSYPGQYVTEKSTPNRIAETILKFEEDVFGEYKIKGRRKADVIFCEPINLFDFVDDDGNSPKTAVGDITEKIASAIQSVLS